MMGHPSKTSTTPKSQGVINYGWKMIKNLYVSGRHVMYTVFCWGTPLKDKHIDLLTYLNNLPNTSTANYRQASSNQRKIKPIQKQQIIGNPACDKFDITLLFPCIRLACENVASLEDQSWFTKGSALESHLYQIKQQRNTALHEELEMSEVEFIKKSSELLDLLIETLNKARDRYNKSPSELATEVQIIKDQFDRTSVEPVGVDDLLVQCGQALMQDLVRDAAQHLKDLYKDDILMDPLSFLSGKRLRIKVERDFIKFKKCSQVVKSELVYEDLLSVIGSSRPQVVAVEGLAGSGKSSLATLITGEWIGEGSRSLKGLQNYQLLLRINCRDSHLDSFDKLLEDLILKASLRYRSLLPRLIKLCRLLIVIDGFDESNTNSTQLIRDLLDQLQRVQGCAIICTSRPQALQDFLRIVPQKYDVNVVKLVGIPVDLRPRFVHYYYEEIKKAQETNRNEGEVEVQSGKVLVNKVRAEKYKEHYRLPLNLVLLAWLYFYKPEILKNTTTQAALYHNVHLLCQEKLGDRLARHAKTKDLTARQRKEKVKSWLPELYLKSLKALARNQVILLQGTVDSLVGSCGKLGLPEDEVMAAFLNMKTIWTPVEVLEQYSAPHKGLLDYYAAMSIILSLCENDGVGSILSIMERCISDGSNRVDLAKYQNVLQQVACLLYLHLDVVEDTVACEIVQLLHESGVRSQDQWLDILDSFKVTPAVVRSIAKHFPIPDSALHVENNDDDNVDDDYDRDDYIRIEDGRVSSYTALLPHLPATRVAIESEGEQERIKSLIAVLDKHKCIMVQFWSHFHYPKENPTSDYLLDLLLTSQPRQNIKLFVGQISEPIATRLPACVSHLRLAITTDKQAALIPHLHKMPHLNDLSIHIASEVNPGTLTPLPDLRDNDGGSSVFLRVSDVRKGKEQRAVQMVAALHPKPGFWDVWFPRANLDVCGWTEVVEGLVKCGVRIGGLRIPASNISSDQCHQIDKIARVQLNASTGIKRFDFKCRGWEQQ